MTPYTAIADAYAAMKNGNRGGLGQPRVGIIGAGVSGLAACKQCCEKGLNATVFEGKSGLGGIWRDSYSSTKLQTPKGAYVFSDFPWPESVPTFPSHHQVIDYLEGYAKHFGFMDRIRFNCQVVEVKRKTKFELSHKMGTSEFSSLWNGEDGVKPELESFMAGLQNGGGAKGWDDGDVTWEICVRKNLPGSEGPIDYVDEWHTFDYLVICCGRFGDVAKLPSFPSSQGPEVFKGQVLHSLDYSALDSKNTEALIRGKKVVVVGFGKTSLDVAVEVAEMNEGVDDVKPCTLLFRRAQWMFPKHRKAFGLFSFGYLWGNRISGYFVAQPGQGLVQRLLQFIFNPVKLLIWKLLECYLSFTIPVAQYGIVPEQPLFSDMSACVLPQLPQTLLGHLQAGRIVTTKAASWNFYPKGIRLADGTEMEANVVIFCTGYDGNSKLKAIFPEDDTAALFETERVLSLYRGIVHPRIPNVGFIGYLEGLSSVHSSEMAARWLVELVQKRITLPDIATMETDRRTWVQYWKTRTPFFDRTCACVGTMQIWHFDKLCKDMGVKTLRKKTWWEEVFSIYGSTDYKSLSS
ncbi:unnamed protein product [Calypogeia fissa]